MKRQFLLIGGILLLFLGVGRGGGGVVLLARGAPADPNIRAGGFAVAVVGAVLLVLGLALVVVALAVLRRSYPFWLVAVVCTVVFVVGGAVNGFVLYGRPGARGILVNGIAAAVILLCLFLGKGALRGKATEKNPSS